MTVNDNDTAGVTISETAVEVTEGEAAATYMVVLSSAPAVSATVTIDPGSSTTAPITVAPAALTLTFGSDDWDTAQAVTVTATEDDDAIGGLRTLAHTVTGYGAVPAVASVAVTVIDNDTAGVTISETAVEVTEGEAAATYMVMLSSAPAVSATVTIDPGSSTTAPITVAPAALTLTFGSDDWDTAQAVTVTATEDDDAIGGLRTLAHTVTGYGDRKRGCVGCGDGHRQRHGRGDHLRDRRGGHRGSRGGDLYGRALQRAGRERDGHDRPWQQHDGTDHGCPGGPYPHFWFGRLGHCPSRHRDGHRG